MNKLNSYSEFIIIKTGQFESFVSDLGNSYSLGDVLRTTSLLAALGRELKIHWFTHEKAIPLLPKMPNLKISEFNLSAVNLIPDNENTLTINLERNPELTPYLKKNRNIVGFIFENNDWQIKDLSGKIYSLDLWSTHCNSVEAYTWGARMLRILNLTSEKTLPIYQKPRTEFITDIGFNWHVGNKWPSKKISDHLWKKMESDLQSRYKISWQKGLDSIPEYASWIASNRLIISIDSLGLHLANAMNIPVIGLFGSTDYKLHDAGPRSRFIAFEAPETAPNCIPCWKSDCFQKIHCSEHIDFNKIYELVDTLLF